MPSSRDLRNPVIERASPVLPGRFFTTSVTQEAQYISYMCMYINKGSIKIFSFFRNIISYFFLMKVKPSRTLWSSLGYKSFPCPPFLVCRKYTSFSLLELPQVPMGRFKTVANQKSEGMQKQRRNNQETIMQQWSSVSVPPQGMYVTVSLSSSLRTKALHPGGD